MNRETTTSTNDQVKDYVVIAGGASGASLFVLIGLIILICVCYRRSQSGDASLNGVTHRPRRKRSKDNPYGSTPTNQETTVQVEMPEIVSDNHHRTREVHGATPSSEGNYATVETLTRSVVTGQTGATTSGAVAKDRQTTDPLYSKVKKTKKRTRSSYDLYSKPIKKRIGLNNRKSRTIETRTNEDQHHHPGSSRDNKDLDDLYTKSTKQKRSRSRGGAKSGDDDEMYSKPNKKKKKTTKQAYYANYGAVKEFNGGIDEAAEPTDPSQVAKEPDKILDNELYSS